MTGVHRSADDEFEPADAHYVFLHTEPAKMLSWVAPALTAVVGVALFVWLITDGVVAWIAGVMFLVSLTARAWMTLRAEGEPGT